MPLLPVTMKKLTGMDESLDEMMIMVARETNYPLADLEKMEIIRFLRTIENVKKIVKARVDREETESMSEKTGGPRRDRRGG